MEAETEQRAKRGGSGVDGGVLDKILAFCVCLSVWECVKEVGSERGYSCF